MDLDRLRRIQTGLLAAARPLEEAVTCIVGLQVAEATWTSFTYSLAVAYNELEAFTLQELQHRAGDTVKIHEGVKHSADAWEAAEYASTPKVI